MLLALLVGVTLSAPLSSASVDGLTIHSSSTGAGAGTIVFVHGWTCDSSSWTGQVPAFAKKYRVITLDLPGHGKSGSPKDGKFSMDLFRGPWKPSAQKPRRNASSWSDTVWARR